MTDPEKLSAARKQPESDEALANMSRLLEEASYLLNSWSKSKDSDSVQRQNRRQAEYAEACQLLGTVYWGIFKTDKRMCLTSSIEGVAAELCSFRKTTYGFMNISHRGELQPGEALVLDRQQELMNVDHHGRSTSVYYGEIGRHLEVAAIADVLAQGGTLELVDKENVDQAPPVQIDSES